ncbi:MAG: hypothetical protein ACKVYV_16905 [Limisphaerales bacterium]
MATPKLPPPDSFHLDAALGWLGLSAPDEALADLDRIAPEHQSAAVALALRFAALSRLRRHADAREVAEGHTRRHPKDSQGWINLANVLFWLDDAQAAHDCAAAQVDAFPDEWSLPYNLACYSVKLDRIEDARRWLGEAVRRGRREVVHAAALRDADLAPLHAELRAAPADAR